MPFQQLGLAPQVIQAVKDAGYTEPTPIQTAAIPVILQGQDLMGIAQTGTGKTAAFVLPLLSLMAAHPPQHRGVRGLIMVPTRELVVQVEENIRTYARHLQLRVATIFGGVSERPQIKALQQGVDLIVATPGRLLDVIRGREPSLRSLEFLVLDEADRMLDMGFIHPIRQIVRLLPRQRLTLLFSATLSREIEQLSREFMHHPKTVEIGRRSNPADTVTQYLFEVSHHAKMALLSHLLANESLKTVLVFSRTKHGADRIARRLEKARIPCATLHANRSQNQRLRALRDFKHGRVRVLVATDIAARGIDVEGISHVINFDFPRHPEDYVHRIGRTGRAQAVGEAISFLAPDDHAHLRTLERFLRRGILRKKVEGFTEPNQTSSPQGSVRTSPTPVSSPTRHHAMAPTPRLEKQAPFPTSRPLFLTAYSGLWTFRHSAECRIDAGRIGFISMEVKDRSSHPLLPVLEEIPYQTGRTFLYRVESEQWRELGIHKQDRLLLEFRPLKDQDLALIFHHGQSLLTRYQHQPIPQFIPSPPAKPIAVADTVLQGVVTCLVRSL